MTLSCPLRASSLQKSPDSLRWRPSKSSSIPLIPSRIPLLPDLSSLGASVNRRRIFLVAGELPANRKLQPYRTSAISPFTSLLDLPALQPAQTPN